MPDTKYDEGDFISAAEAPTFPSAAVIATTIQLQPGLQRAVNPEHPLFLKFNPREISEKRLMIPRKPWSVMAISA